MAPELQPHSSHKKRWLSLSLLLLVALAILPPIVTVNRFRHRLENAMSAAVGRTVTVHNVHLRFLPQPGFDLDHFEIADDPAMSSEPMLRSDKVSASLRLTSLWRGRVEISRLSLKDASLNLVRGNDGHWNVEMLLLRASQIPTAPTALPHAAARPRFPYIEATNGRVNFKSGNEKKVYFLNEADFALWLASEDQWEARLTARPGRTDADLGDTGSLELNAHFNRAQQIGPTPFQMKISLQKAQLGQLTQLISGRDRGWRGRVDSETSLSGTPTDTNIELTASVADFRRYDIASSEAFNAQFKCSANFTKATPAPPQMANGDSSTDRLRGNCSTQRGRGLLNLAGLFYPDTGNATLNVVAASFPMSALVELAKHMKRNVADDLSADGVLNGKMVLHRGPAAPESLGMMQDGRENWTFTAQTTLHSKMLQPDLDLGLLVWNLDQPVLLAKPITATAHKRHLALDPNAPARFSLLPAKINLGGAAPALLSGSADSREYGFNIQGEADPIRLQEFLAALGLPLPADDDPPAKSIARVDLQVSGQWAGFSLPVVAGRVRPLPGTAVARSKVQ